MEWRKEWRLEMSKKNDGQYKDFVPYDKCNKRGKKRQDNQKIAMAFNVQTINVIL